MANARQIAFEALLKTEKDKAYSNLTLDSYLSKSQLDTRDKSFVSNLFYGVIERKLTIDYQLSKYLSKPLKKLKPEVLVILRLGAYQLFFSDKVPVSAAVNESVSLAKKNGCSFASGLVNAVLRKCSANGLILPDKDNFTEYLSIKYSCPEWLCEKWLNEYGEEDTIGILSHSLEPQKIFVRVNTLKTTEEELLSIFSEEGVSAEKTQHSNVLAINLHGKDIEKLPSFKNGFFHVQDLSCQLCSKALNAQKGHRVFDLCSAPGGKAYTVAEIMEDKGVIACFDIHKSRVELIKKGAKRLCISSIKASVNDATTFNDSLGKADRILCDVPCSGLGIIGRKPEIKYKDRRELEDLPSIQISILKNASEYLENGGLLIYSTCSLSKDENELICDEFLKSNEGFYSVAPLPELSDEKYVTLMPHKTGGDGFFIAAFKKKE